MSINIFNIPQIKDVTTIKNNKLAQQDYKKAKALQNGTKTYKAIIKLHAR